MKADDASDALKEGEIMTQKEYRKAAAQSEENAQRTLFDKYFNKETVLSTIAKDGVFTINYHLIINDKMLPVTLRAVIAHEYDGDKLIIGVSKQDHALRL